MANHHSGDTWALGRRYTGGRRRRRASFVTTFVAFALVLGSGAAFADQLAADADSLVLAAPHGNSVPANQAVGTTASYDFSAVINDTGNTSNDVFPGNVSVTISRAGDWVAAGGTAGPWAFTAYGAPQAGTIAIAVPADACDV